MPNFSAEIGLDALIFAVTLGIGLSLWSPRFKSWTPWRAMTTPLASIIGSGFLVLGPVLISAYGAYAPLAMAALCGVAYALGGAIRYNIAALAASDRAEGRLARGVERAAAWALAFAYVVSVAYYLNLLGAFGVSLTPFDDELHAKLLTTGVFLAILWVGWTRGFGALELMEYASVSVKLAVIGGLLAGLSFFFLERSIGGELILNAPQATGWPAATLAFGLIVTVQGFETSRYLGAEYDARTRIVSMRWAQWVSTGVYMAYILVIAFVFDRSALKLSETAVVEMMRLVAPILPALLVAAALAAQFSAAVADTGGSGGLFAELTAGRLSARAAYVLLTAAGLLLTWSANVFEIIAYASRAFAIYYALQAGLAAIRARAVGDRVWRQAGFAGLAALAAAIAAFGQPVEG